MTLREVHHVSTSWRQVHQRPRTSLPKLWIYALLLCSCAHVQHSLMFTHISFASKSPERRGEKHKRQKQRKSSPSQGFCGAAAEAAPAPVPSGCFIALNEICCWSCQKCQQYMFSVLNQISNKLSTNFKEEYVSSNVQLLVRSVKQKR